MKSPSSSTTTSAIQPNPLLQPNIQIMGGLSLALLGLAMVSGFSNKKGKTANAAFATTRQKGHCSKLGKIQLATPRPSAAAGFIQQPVGGATNLNIALKNKNTVYLPFLNQSTLVIGGAGAGKTVNAILPIAESCLQQGFSFIHYEYKGLQFSKTLIARAFANGYNIRIFAPGHEVSGSFNVLDLVKDEKSLDEAKEVIWIMALNLFDDHKKARDYFEKAGSVIAAASLLLARWVAKEEGDEDLANLLMASQILGLDHLGLRLKHNRSKINPWTYDAFVGLTSIQGDKGTSKQQTGVVGTAQEVFAPLQSINLIPVIAQPSSLPRFDPNDPLKIDGKQLIVCVVDKNKRSIVTPILATFLHNIISYNLNGSQPRQTPLFCCFDEAATIRIPSLLGFINQERSNGFCGIFGYQYLGQIEDSLGPKAPQGFLASCGTKFYFNPGDLETAKTVSEILGKKEIVVKNDSRSHGKNTTRSVNDQRYQIPLMEADAILQMPKGQAVIVNPGVGDRSAASVPYIHNFKYSEAAEKAANASDNEVFDKIYQTLKEQQNPHPPEYYEQMLVRYREILERLFPLPTDVQSDSSDNEKPANEFSVKGSDIARALSKAKESTTAVDQTKNYPVPQHLVGADGNVSLSVQNCLEIIGELSHV